MRFKRGYTLPVNVPWHHASATSHGNLARIIERSTSRYRHQNLFFSLINSARIVDLSQRSNLFVLFLSPSGRRWEFLMKRNNRFVKHI